MFTSPCSITASLNDTSRDPYPFTTGDNLSRNRSAVLVADEAGNFSTTQCLLPTGCTLRSGSLTVLGDAENGTAVFQVRGRFFLVTASFQEIFRAFLCFYFLPMHV